MANCYWIRLCWALYTLPYWPCPTFYSRT